MGRLQVEKIIGHQSTLDKARFIFNISPTKTIRVNDARFKPSVRLNRTELRALERAGHVKKMRGVGKRKFTDTTAPMFYFYEWTGAVNKDGRPSHGEDTTVMERQNKKLFKRIGWNDR